MIEIITLFSKHLEQQTLSDKIRDVFFDIIESNNTLPDNASPSLIQMFLSSLISVISLKENDKIAFR